MLNYVIINYLQMKYRNGWKVKEHIMNNCVICYSNMVSIMCIVMKLYLNLLKENHKHVLYNVPLYSILPNSIQLCTAPCYSSILHSIPSHLIHGNPVQCYFPTKYINSIKSIKFYSTLLQ